MKLQIVTPERVVVDEEGVEHVRVASVNGQMGILPSHAPLFAELDIAPLYFDKGGEREIVGVMGGVAHVQSDKITILSEAAERAEEIDEVRAHQAEDRAAAYLTRKQETIDLARAEVALRRALVRLKVSKERKRRGEM